MPRLRCPSGLDPALRRGIVGARRFVDTRQLHYANKYWKSTTGGSPLQLTVRGNGQQAYRTA